MQLLAVFAFLDRKGDFSYYFGKSVQSALGNKNLTEAGYKCKKTSEAAVNDKLRSGPERQVGNNDGGVQVVGGRRNGVGPFL